MPKYRRMKHMEESNGASGEYPEYGAIFMSNNSTRKECLRRELFGLPMRQAGFVKQVKAGMMLFLFEFESRELHGVFQACSDGAVNIEPNAFRSSGKQFPAQVKFTEKWRCRPLPESEFRHAIRENYFTATKFNFGLSKAQVQRLLKLFSLKKEDRSWMRKTAVVKPTRKAERNLRNTAADRGFGNRSAGETDGDVERESAGDARGRRLTENYGIAQASSCSNDKERLNFEADPVVPLQSIPLDLPYGTNTGYYDPCKPGIMGDATMTSSRHDLGAPNIDLIGSASFTANSNYGLGEEFIPVGGYVSDALPSETVQPFPDEHNGATENMRKFERLPYSDHRIFPSFAYPLSSRDLSPKDGLNNEILTYQHQEEFGGRVSYTNDMVVRGSSIYLSFTYPSTSGDGADLYPENRTNNKVQAYQRHEEFGGDAFDSNNRVTQMKDRVNPAELGRHRTRESVFKRLGVPSKERDAEKDTSPDTESVDEVMAFLNDCHKHWMEQKRSNMSTSEDSGKPKKKKEKIRTAEVLDNDLMLSFTETTQDDLVDCEGSMEHSVQKLPFINFKRRSKAQKSPGNPTQGCKESPEHSASQNKKRKLLRPKLIEDDLEKDRGNNADPIVKFLASQSATEVPVHDFLGRNEGNSQKNRGKSDDSIENLLASQSATKVPVPEFLGRNEGDSEKDRGKNDDPIENFLASQSAVEVPVHDFLGRDEDDSEKDRGNDGDPIENVLASQSATEVPFHDFLGRDDR